MAISYSHILGELIGNFFEDTIIQFLNPMISSKGCYLDYRHPRQTRDGKKEVLGTDLEGNAHKLDIVIEAGGDDNKIGKPIAFIEIAWRRYVKHSKAKVQEIAGAIMPLVRTYHQHAPFYAAILSGEFTDNAINQLKSQGFYVLYFTYKEMAAIFKTAGISIYWDEDSKESVMKGIAKKIKSLSKTEYESLQKSFFNLQAQKLQKLADELEKSISRVITQVVVLPIHGTTTSLQSINDAIRYISNYNETNCNASLIRYELKIKYSNGDEIMMTCSNKRNAIQFLNQYVYPA